MAFTLTKYVARHVCFPAFHLGSSTTGPCLKLAHILRSWRCSGSVCVSEARRSPEGFITVDFLTGQTSGCRPSPSLARAIELYRDALPDLCGRHGTSQSVFRELTARYSVEKRAKRFVVTTADHRGRRQVDEYVGIPGKHVRTLEPLGRVRSSKKGLARSKSIKSEHK